MDSKAVTARIRRSIYPLLADVGGFTMLKGRNAWRFDAHTTSVVNFQSFSPSLADACGCTTFSFGLTLGVFLRLGMFEGSAPPEETPPEVWSCHVRIELAKSIPQPYFVPYASTGKTERTDRTDIFFVAKDGSNLDEVVADARGVLERTGLPCLERFRDLSYTYRYLIRGDPSLPSSRGPTNSIALGGFLVEGAEEFDAPRCSAIVHLGRLIGAADPQADLEQSPKFPFLRQRPRAR